MMRKATWVEMSMAPDYPQGIPLLENGDGSKFSPMGVPGVKPSPLGLTGLGMGSTPRVPVPVPRGARLDKMNISIHIVPGNPIHPSIPSKSSLSLSHVAIHPTLNHLSVSSCIQAPPPTRSLVPPLESQTPNHGLSPTRSLVARLLLDLYVFVML